MSTKRSHNVVEPLLALLLLAVPLLRSGTKLTLPPADKAVRFAVIGDSGTGGRPQYQVAREMSDLRSDFPFEFVLMLGDNIYGPKTAEDFRRKFQEPYQPLLDAGVKFYASLGNHDESAEREYKPFNMNGKQYYSFRKGNAEFFALDSNYMDPEQLTWLQQQLAASNATWKICFFHHPLYSDGKTHGPSLDLRKELEPIFVANGVNLVLSGHEHFYERFKPQKGITYIVLGSSGQLRLHDVRASQSAQTVFDTGRAFLLVEIVGDQLYFQTFSGTGESVDSGVLAAPGKRTAAAASRYVVSRPPIRPRWAAGE